MKNYSLLCERCDGSEIATKLNEFNQSLERKKNFPSLVYGLKKKTSYQEILCLSRAATAKKSGKCAPSCTCSSCRVMFCLLEPKTTLPNETDLTDISFLVMAFYIITE